MGILKPISLQDLIQQYVLLGGPSSTGWHSVKCAVCNDYKIRGAFKFDDCKTVYHCFNCGVKSIFDGSVDPKISQHMKGILQSFNVPENEIDKCSALSLFATKSVSKNNEEQTIGFPNKEQELPPNSKLISGNESIWCEVAREYLKSRHISPDCMDFYVSDDPKWAGRVCIPFKFRNKIVYWQARAMDDTISIRYKNVVAPKDNIFFNMDEIYRYTNEPLFVTEGPIDALSIGSNAVSFTGSSISKFHLQELIKVSNRRRIVFIIDKNMNGYKLGKLALKHNFYVTCFPDNVDDANDALIKYGKLWLINHVTSTAVTGIIGETLLTLKCSA